MMAFPAWSTAMQSEAVGHDTALSFWLPSTSARVHVPLLHWRTPPELSTAAQYDAVGHETPVRPTLSTVADAGAGSMRCAADHAWPFHWRTSPVWSTAVQNEIDGHETPLNEEVLVYGLGIAHCSPFHWEMPPDTETQKDAETQEIDETDPQSPLVPCHDWPSEAKAFPSESTDAQYPVGAQPTASSPVAPSTVIGADQLWPFQLMIWLPAVATAMHSEGLAHETDTAPGPSACGAAGTGPLHPVPSKW
jgi:hypothetical protein